jgi:hypothetical protein
MWSGAGAGADPLDGVSINEEKKKWQHSKVARTSNFK